MRHTPVAVALALLLTVGLTAAPAAAAGSADADVDAAVTADVDAEEVVEAYNEHVDEAPDVVRDRFADERVALVVERGGEPDVEYTAVTDGDARVVSLEDGSDDPTVRVTTDEATVDEIAGADDEVDAALDAYHEDRVEVEGVGITNTVVVGATEVGYAVASELGLL